MGNNFSTFLTWAAFIVDGNHLTNKVSIGHKSSLTGKDPKAPAIVGGFNTHHVFEGDASATRDDFDLGNNYLFNATLWKTFVSASKSHGNGSYNIAAAAEVRWLRIQDSMARNPAFEFTLPRYFTAYAESTFPYQMMVDGRNGNSGQLNLDVAYRFFEGAQFPVDFHRRDGPFDFPTLIPEVITLLDAHPVKPGHNAGAGNYVLNPDDPGATLGACGIYTTYVNNIVIPLYPNTDGALKLALANNLKTFYNSVLTAGPCAELLPFGNSSSW